MLSGPAVVGSSSGAIPDVVGNAGLIFPEGDITVLTATLQRLLDDKELRESLVQRGFEHALETYSTTAMARQFYQLCQTFSSPR